MPSASKKNKEQSIIRNLDWFTLFIFVVLVAMGWMSVCGASYDFDQGTQLLDFSSRSGMQMVWILTSLVLGSVILCVDDRLVESLSYIIYIGFIVLLFVTPMLAHDIKGSLSWIKIGPFSLQPAEFAKFATALCVAKVISSFNFDLSRWRDLIISTILVLLPMGLIVMQKETGSALVYLAFFLMFYREGMIGSILFAGAAAVFYFVVGVRFADAPLWDIPQISMGEFLVLAGIHLFSAGMMWVYTSLRKPFLQVLLFGMSAYVLAVLYAKYLIPVNTCWVQWIVLVVMVGYLFYLSVREQLLSYALIALFAIGSTGFFYSVNYVLSDVLQPHQQTRIRVLLGLEDDPKGAGYNVIQAKIAIGSGGLHGKGFLNGTQTKLKYVPEQDTDFIFCTVGEEQGFVGSALVLAIFLVFILRLIHLAERQPLRFGRVYGYCVMSVFLFHVFINVGMVLGLTPVIGIPLPFFSYGGSSLWGFTILLFVFLRIDAARNRMQH
ncbi:MAG: rod shape-determining protein RodA [Bacteroidaceae bacterium]|nr:rod shape-determining protein RodA [Bacteroidaceae bacterium]